MKAQELRELNENELSQKLADCGEELFNLRAQGRTGQLQNNSKIRSLKKEIARIKTVISDASYQKVAEESEQTKVPKKKKKK